MSGRTENKKWSCRSFRIPLSLLIAVVAYVLSVGPVGTIATRLGLGPRLHRALRVFYAPVFAVARSTDSGTRVYEDYVGFWCRLVLNQDYPKYRPDPPVENLIAAIGSITNGQASVQIFVPSKADLEQVIGKVREHGLLPAGFQQQPHGRLYTFERERDWERKASE